MNGSIQQMYLEFQKKLDNLGNFCNKEQYTDQQKTALIEMMEILSNKEFRERSNVTDKKQIHYIGEVMLIIAVNYNDSKLISWLLDNKYAGENSLMNKSHISFAEALSFEIDIDKISEK